MINGSRRFVKLDLRRLQFKVERKLADTDENGNADDADTTLIFADDFHSFFLFGTPTPISRTPSTHRPHEMLIDAADDEGAQPRDVALLLPLHKLRPAFRQP